MHPCVVPVILGFLTNCQRCGVAPSLGLFRSIYYILDSSPRTPQVYTVKAKSSDYEFILSRPDSVGDWIKKGCVRLDSVHRTPGWNEAFRIETPDEPSTEAYRADREKFRASKVNLKQYYLPGTAMYMFPRSIYPDDAFKFQRFEMRWGVLSKRQLVLVMLQCFLCFLMFFFTFLAFY